MLAYMTASEAAEKWCISHRRVITLCQENRIPDVDYSYGRIPKFKDFNGIKKNINSNKREMLIAFLLFV